MLSEDGQLRDSSIVTHFFSFRRSADSSATSENRPIPEGIVQNEEPTSTKKERTRNTSSSSLVSDLNFAQ